MDTPGLLDIGYQVFCAFPAIAGIACYRYLSKAARILVLYYILVVIVELFSRFIMRSGHTNIWLYHFFDPFEYLAIALAFSYWIANQKLKKALRYSIPGFIIISIANSIRMPDIYHYSYDALSVAYVVYALISSYTIYEIIIGERGVVTSNPVFWLAASLLMMSVNNELWYALHDTWVKTEYYLLIFNLHNIFNIISFVFSTFGIIRFRHLDKVEKASEVSVYWN